mgnify:CR=1 FL=1
MEDTDHEALEILVSKVVDIGDRLTDKDAIEALCVTLAKLTQDEFSMRILEKRNLFDSMLTMVLNLLSSCYDMPLASETCGIAICRISLQLGTDQLSDDRKQDIARGLIKLLDSTCVRAGLDDV